MSNTGTTYKLAIAGVLAGFLAVPAMADDYGQSSEQQAMPEQSSNEQAEDSQPEQQHEPTYIWHGNHYKGQAEATPASVPESQMAESRGGTIVIPTTNNLPQAEEANGVHFITGGIGDEERNALDAVKNEYSLHVVSSNRNGEFDGDTEVTVFSRKGDKVLSVTGGPLFYINLPVGAYTVQASSGGRTEKQNITIGNKPSSTYFRW